MSLPARSRRFNTIYCSGDILYLYSLVSIFEFLPKHGLTFSILRNFSLRIPGEYRDYVTKNSKSPGVHNRPIVLSLCVS